MVMSLFLFLLLFLVTGGSTREFTGELRVSNSKVSCDRVKDEEIYKFPSLYHLDDYHRCLSQKNGLYCVGTFALTPTTQLHPTYELMKEYSNLRMTFNRTLIHRGYCLSTRCPSTERNASLRFERCAAQWGQKRSLRTTLHTLHYCRTYKDTQIANHHDIWQRLFKYTICLILFLNIIGTMYDLTTTQFLSKNKYLLFWSVRLNWKRFTATYEDGDPRLNALTPIQGARVILMFMMLLAHTVFIRYRIYSLNPEFLEKAIERVYYQIFVNCTSGTHSLFVLSTYLTCYNILLISEKYPISLNLLPVYILKRISRISPTYLLVIGFVVTWWPLVYDGPLWPLVVTSQSKMCIRKFWPQVFHINNMVDKQDICVAPTWFLAVDFHLNILAVILTVIAVRMRRRVFPTFAALYIGSCLLVAGIAYIYNLKAALHFGTPEKLRNTFRDELSFREYYISTWSAIPACFLGVFMGFLQYEHTTKGFKKEDYKWLTFFPYICFPLLLIWLSMGGYILKEYTSPIATSLFVLFERPVFCLTSTALFYGAINIDGPVRRIWGWHGFQSLGRLSLSIMLVNWPIAETLVAIKQQPVSSSVIEVVVDVVALIFFSILLALPLTILVELPMRGWLGELIFKYFIAKKIKNLDSDVVNEINKHRSMKLQ